MELAPKNYISSYKSNTKFLVGNKFDCNLDMFIRLKKIKLWFGYDGSLTWLKDSWVMCFYTPCDISCVRR